VNQEVQRRSNFAIFGTKSLVVIYVNKGTILRQHATIFQFHRGIAMSHINPEQWADFTAKVEALCGEFLCAIERDRYSPAEVIQAACNIIAAAIEETGDGDKELAIQATQRWIDTSFQRAKAGTPSQYLN
jgi:hypothetical protein